MNRQAKKAAAVALCMGMVCAAGGAMAYFTDTETKVNTFQIGSIETTLTEPNWVEPEEVLPEEEYKKDPTITNTGDNDAYVFLKVSVPYANIVTAKENGEVNAQAADTELFTYTVKSGWTEVGTASKDTAAKVVNHVYAYVGTDTATMQALASGQASTLFDAVKFVNATETSALEGESLDLTVTSYAIQTTVLNNQDATIDGTNGNGKSAPADVWAVINAK